MQNGTVVTNGQMPMKPPAAPKPPMGTMAAAMAQAMNAAAQRKKLMMAAKMAPVGAPAAGPAPMAGTGGVGPYGQ